MKKCTKCKGWKHESQFHVNNAVKSGLHSRCKTCRCLDQKIYKSTRREYYTHREWLKNLKRYGLSEHGWKAMFANQSGRCKICHKEPEERLHVDHCHQTRKIRGLLCGACNRGLGQFKDDPELLKRAIKYLED